MDQPIKDRRNLSQSGLLDTAIRALTTLSAAGEPAKHSLAGQALAALIKLRRELPARRQCDRRIP